VNYQVGGGSLKGGEQRTRGDFCIFHLWEHRDTGEMASRWDLSFYLFCGGIGGERAEGFTVYLSFFVPCG